MASARATACQVKNCWQQQGGRDDEAILETFNRSSLEERVILPRCRQPPDRSVLAELSSASAPASVSLLFPPANVQYNIRIIHLYLYKKKISWITDHAITKASYKAQEAAHTARLSSDLSTYTDAFHRSVMSPMTPTPPLV